MKTCECGTNAYHSWYEKKQKTFCFKCNHYVDSEILGVHEEECLPNEPVRMPDILGLPDQSDIPWKNISPEMARHYGWYVSILKEGGKFLVLPVYRNGKMVFWTARNLDKTGEPKYLGAHGSRKAYWLSDEQYPTGDLFIAESIADACYLSLLGQSVGLLGTSYNGSLNNWMKSATKIIICFDGDIAGRVASLTTAKYLRDNSICKRVYILPIPIGKDPNDLEIGELKELVQELA